MNSPIISILYVISFVLMLSLLLKLNRRINIFSKNLLERHNDLETIMLDIRNGTKTFFKEKRRALRVGNSVSAKLADNEKAEFIKVLNISETGALLRSKEKFSQGEVLDFKLYLPLFTYPIDVVTKVARAAPSSDKDKAGYFDIGITFLKITSSDKEKLLETVDVLKKLVNK